MLWAGLPGPVFSGPAVGSLEAGALPSAFTVPGTGQCIEGAWLVFAGRRDPLARQGLLECAVLSSDSQTCWGQLLAEFLLLGLVSDAGFGSLQ